jgi:hypothetical protein
MAKKSYTIKPYTVRARAIWRAFAVRINSNLDALKENTGIPLEALDSAIVDYCMMSIRVDGANDLDFEWLAIDDDYATIERKFLVYLDSAKLDLIDEMLRQMNAMDAPHDPDLAPDVELPEGED